MVCPRSATLELMAGSIQATMRTNYYRRAGKHERQYVGNTNDVSATRVFPRVARGAQSAPRAPGVALFGWEGHAAEGRGLQCLRCSP